LQFLWTISPPSRPGVCSLPFIYSEWTPAPEQGVVFSFTIVHHPAHPAMAESVPYNIVIVDFPECGHARLVSNLIDAAPEEIRIGMEVALTWETAGNGMLAPRFKKR
jgi:uncharacterized protein